MTYIEFSKFLNTIIFNEKYNEKSKMCIDKFITNIFNKISSNINNNIDAEISSLTYWKLYPILIHISRINHTVNDIISNIYHGIDKE